ncbi:MAG TPA: aminotransferase, partial [Pusillimonas sp.]|nr:aminotransferase [Pusillimonas sp.]
LINPGAEILMPDPSYPANQNFIRCAGGQPKLIPCGPEKRFQLSAQDIDTHWGPDTRGVVI